MHTIVVLKWSSIGLGVTIWWSSRDPMEATSSRRLIRPKSAVRSVVAARSTWLASFSSEACTEACTELAMARRRAHPVCVRDARRECSVLLLSGGR